MASTRDMCRSKKSISGQTDLCSSSRISVSAVVEKANGVTGPAAAASRIATTFRASSTEEMNGISRRSKCRSGNWISSALPMVSALIPVLSERKKTGTTRGRCRRDRSWSGRHVPSWLVRRVAKG